MVKILKFGNIQYFPLWGIALFYLPQSIIGMIFFDGFYSAYVFILAIVSSLAYFIFYHLVFSSKSFYWIKNIRKFNLGVTFFPFTILTAYLGITAYAAFTIDQVALVAVFKGANIDELSKSRGDFLGNRIGWESALPYLYTILKMALMPYAVATLFFIRHRFRFYFLLIFLVTLSLTLEKSLILVALIPLIILAANSPIKKVKVKRIVFILLVLIGAISFLSRGGIGSAMEGVQSDNSNAAFIPIDYQLFKNDSQMGYILNRVVWIPFATAIDWLKYKDQVLDGRYSLGSSIGVVAAALGVPKANFEKEVFRFQWGQNEDETGTSNTVFFVDAFVNFSWFGVIVYAAILAAIVRVIAVSDNIPAKSAVYVSLFYLSFNSLPPILFSGGLVFLLLIMLLVKPFKADMNLRPLRLV